MNDKIRPMYGVIATEYKPINDKCIWKFSNVFYNSCNNSHVFTVTHFDDEETIPIYNSVIKHLHYCMICNKEIELKETE